MSSLQLLDKTRKIGTLLHNNDSGKVMFNDICRVMRDVLSSCVVVISRKGKILGISKSSRVTPGGSDGLKGPMEGLLTDRVGGFIDEELNERLMEILSTKENVNLETLGMEQNDAKEYVALISPIEIAGERYGTLFVYKTEGVYSIDDIILSEYGTTVIGLEMLRSVAEENAEEMRKNAMVRSAVGTLSSSEEEAICLVFDELQGNEGILVASRIADRAGITRSVIVNALRKFESAGVIESRSSGMKGTFVRVLNDAAFLEIKKIRSRIIK